MNENTSINSDDEKLAKRVEKAFENRSGWESLWRTVYDYVCPERRLDTSPNVVGEAVFDSTAIDAAERLVNLIMSGLIPPWSRWFRMIAGRSITNQVQRDALAPFLSYFEAQLFAALAESNFYQEMQPLLIDRVVGGTGCIAQDLEGSKFVYQAVPLMEYAIEEDAAGNTSMIVRRRSISMRDVLKNWGSKVPSTWDAEKKRNESAKVNIEYIGTREADGLYRYTVRLPDDKHTLESRVLLYPPFLDTRWTRIPGTPYGRGPGLRCLADIRVLNKIKELSLKNAALAVSGIYTIVDDGIVNPYTISLLPGEMIPVASNNTNERSIAELPMAAHFDVGMMSIETLRAGITAMFLSDQFGPIDKTPKTATEISERVRIVAMEHGATNARLQAEILIPILRSAFIIMASRGVVPEQLRLDGRVLNVEFISQLAQAQWITEANNIIAFGQEVAAFGEFDPKAGLILDTTKALRKVGEYRGIPADIMRSDKQIEDLMQTAANTTVALGKGEGNVQ